MCRCIDGLLWVLYTDFWNVTFLLFVSLTSQQHLLTIQATHHDRLARTSRSQNRKTQKNTDGRLDGTTIGNENHETLQVNR